MKYTINGTDYFINEYENGFAWVTKDNEALLSYQTPLEAVQNAIDFERMISDKRERDLADKIEDETYGSYENQVQGLYNGSRL